MKRRIPFYLRRVFFVTGLSALMAVGLLAFVFVPTVAAQSQISIPLTATEPDLDGKCDSFANEYGDALTVSFTDAFSSTGKVHLKHVGGDLYVCMIGFESVNSTGNPHATVYLDTDNGREAVAQSEDLGLPVEITGGISTTLRGTGIGGYTPDPGVVGWDAFANTGGQDEAEWRIPIKLVQPDLCSPFGIAVFHHQVIGTSDAFGWPAGSVFDKPDTWQEARLFDPNCVPDLVVTKVDAPDPSDQGALTYTVVISNAGNAPATNVQMTDTLPSEVHFVSSTPGAPTCSHSGEYVGGTLICSLGTLNPGNSQTVTILVWPIKAGPILNEANATANEPDRNPKDNRATVRTIIKTVKLADLSIDKSDSDDPVTLGQEFAYYLEVKNLGPNDASTVKIVDTLPAGVAYVTYSAPAGVLCTEAAGVVTCTIPSIPSGGSVLIKLVVRAIAVGDWSNTATVGQESPPDPDLSNNTDTERTKIVDLAGKIAYVFRRDTFTANQFKTLLQGKGFTVDLIQLPAVLGTDFNPYDLIIIADDTGDLNQWPHGTTGASPEASHIDGFNKPVVGLGEGGYAYFGMLGAEIGWPHGWHGPLDRVKPDNVGATYYHVPTDFGAPPPDPLGLYAVTPSHVGIYLPSASNVLPFGLEPAATDHAPLIAERNDCNQLWGFSAGPPDMTTSGEDLFVNTVVFGLGRQCAPPPDPGECIELSKEATPPAGTPVQPGDIIAYRVKYSVKNTPQCRAERAELQDPVPLDTIYVPNTASDGISPGADGVLRWNLGALAPGASGEKKFEVYVKHTSCVNQRTINNRARLVSDLGIFFSNVVSHPVECPPVVPDDPSTPPYAEDEIQIYPYPLVAGHSTEIKVRIRSLISVTQQVSVSLETSPQNFGIGIDFSTMTIPNNPKAVTLPPFGVVEVIWNWTPPKSGHFCIRVRIVSAGHEPIFTQRNLDVTENLQPGVPDELPIPVRNPKSTTENILLVVDNTCPGWVATVDPAVLTNMTSGEIRNAKLTVIPPTDRPLGTACHIDVQGWIGTELIGGIRKLDVPPVHLPPANPPWMEKEISVIPDPPVVGQPAQICVELQNPLASARTVSIGYDVADFGAGISFTEVASQTVTLPPTSIDDYCINWTPASGGTLHRCIRIRLSQPGSGDQTSQRNVNLVRLPVLSIDELLKVEIPFGIGNPALFDRKLELEAILVGLTPLVRPKIVPDPPPEIKPAEFLEFMLGFEMMNGAQAAGESADDPLFYGDASRVEVTLMLDGEDSGGFTLDIAPPPETELYLPALNK